jgi:hypothetical protein
MSASYIIPTSPNTSVRMALINGVYFVSVYDLIHNLCHSTNFMEAHKIWVSMPTIIFKFPGRVKQHVIMVDDMPKLIMLLPSDTASREHVLSKVTEFISKIETKVTSLDSESRPDDTVMIPFDEIVPGATVRMVVINNIQYLSIRDVIMHVCGKNKNDAGQIWRRMSAESLAEVQLSSDSPCLYFKFPGQGQSQQPIITFRGALKLIMFLPGDVAKKHRSAMTSILTRYFAGDPSLLKEIENNSISTEPINQMAREAANSSQHIEDAGNKRKHEDLSIDVHGPCRESQLTLIDRYNTMCVNQMAIIDKYASLCPNNEADDNAKSIFKNMLLRTAGMQ